MGKQLLALFSCLAILMALALSDPAMAAGRASAWHREVTGQTLGEYTLNTLPGTSQPMAFELELKVLIIQDCNGRVIEEEDIGFAGEGVGAASGQGSKRGGTREATFTYNGIPFSGTYSITYSAPLGIGEIVGAGATPLRFTLSGSAVGGLIHFNYAGSGVGAYKAARIQADCDGGLEGLPVCDAVSLLNDGSTDLPLPSSVPCIAT